MGRTESLFECVPCLKGSIQENTKCGKLDELDVSMKLVNFTKYCQIKLINLGDRQSNVVAAFGKGRGQWPNIKFSGDIRHINLADHHDHDITDSFHIGLASIEFCAAFCLLFMKTMDSQVVRTFIKENGLVIENYRRKYGYVSMLTLSFKGHSSLNVITVDVVPCVDVGGIMALFRQRTYDNKLIGVDSTRILELSSSQQDWNFLMNIPPEIISGYTLAKLLRSLVGTFQAQNGRVYTAEEIIPSYLLKTALLWLLDPEGKFDSTYGPLIENVKRYEPIEAYSTDVSQLCQTLLQQPFKDVDFSDKQISFVLREWLYTSQYPCIHLETCPNHIYHFHKCLAEWKIQNNAKTCVERVKSILQKCESGDGYLLSKDRVLPYVLFTRSTATRKENGIDVTQMFKEAHIAALQNTLTADINCDDEIIYNRRFYIDKGTGHILQKHINDSTAYEASPETRHQRVPSIAISEETARKCRIWAQRILWLLPRLLKSNTGLRNYYLPGQTVYTKDVPLAVRLCKALEHLLRGHQIY